LQKDDYAIWKHSTNTTSAMMGPPTTTKTVVYEKRVVKNATVISGGNECNFTVAVYHNNTNSPSMTNTTGWVLNTTTCKILNKTAASLMNSTTPILPKDVGLDAVFTTDLLQVLKDTVNVMATMPGNSSGMTIRVLKNQFSTQQITGTASSGSINLKYDLSFKYNMSAAPTTFYINNQTIILKENATIDANHLIDRVTNMMNNSMILYLEATPHSPMMNGSTVTVGLYTLEKTYIQTSPPVPGYSTILIIGLIGITSSLLLKKARIRKIQAT